jgi:hypothetical protein
LIEIPYWWDNTLSTLAATIHQHRPELFKEKPTGQPISLIPPKKERKNTSPIADKLMLVSDWPGMDPSGWYVENYGRGYKFAIESPIESLFFGNYCNILVLIFVGGFLKNLMVCELIGTERTCTLDKAH